MVFCLYCWSGAITLSCIVFSAIDKTEKACKMWVVIKTSDTARVVQVCLVHCSALYVTLYRCLQYCKSAVFINIHYWDDLKSASFGDLMKT